MSYNTFNPVIRPKSSSASVAVRVKSNSFGDGYEQVVADGLNSVVESVNLSWPVLTVAQAQSIHAFLKAQNGLPFYWAMPDEAPRLWRCVEWTRPVERGVASMTAKLQEVFA